MKNLIVVVVSAAILAGAYFYSFGVPAALAGLASVEASQGVDAAPANADGRPSGARRANRATTVVLAPLEEQSYALVLRTIGAATALRSVDVVAPQAGTVVEVMLAPNATVDVGDTLVKLDDRTQLLDLDIAIAERDQAQTTMDRYDALTASGSSTVTNVTAAEAEVALRLAEANVGLAEVALADRTILSPISGQLGLSTLHVGDYVTANQAIVSIDDSSVIVAEFEVPERSIGLLQIGKSVLIGTPTYAGRIFDGTITAFDTQLDSVTRSATVRAEIGNSEGLLRSGMTFAVRMIEETDPLPVVPSTAITWDRSGAGIWVSNDGSASRQSIAIRYREGDQVWIETEVPLGADIVVEGAAKLRAGAAVTNANDTEDQS